MRLNAFWLKNVEIKAKMFKNYSLPLLYLVMLTLLLPHSSFSWPFGSSDEKYEDLSRRVNELVARVKGADDDIWTNLIRLRDSVKEDMRLLSGKLNEVIKEVNKIKMKQSILP